MSHFLIANIYRVLFATKMAIVIFFVTAVKGLFQGVEEHVSTAPVSTKILKGVFSVPILKLGFTCLQGIKNCLL